MMKKYTLLFRSYLGPWSREDFGAKETTELKALILFLKERDVTTEFELRDNKKKIEIKIEELV